MILGTNYCVDDPCENGGTCQEADGDYKCLCPGCPCAHKGNNCDTGKICKCYNGT